ncbi:MAG: Stp1/IreP family PP2C-type Ser/Thr phosphatase [Solirubrobacterales bacterium]|jgi:serine/threonine protein phosphatase PrpC|nr:Stp1/IreP family PP2C-type Ser/Thr phosphatase [Solirubrobacterales bacterium]
MLRVAEKAERTDPGRLRRNNEDSFFSRSPLFVIADGMGGAQAGEVASAKAIEVFHDGLPDAGGAAEERLAAMVVEANTRVYELSVSDRELQGMGTTTTAVYVGEEEIALAHVGDSRAYLLRDGSFERLTNDHTLVEELVRQGRITAEEAEEHPQRSIVTRSVGPEAEVQVDRLTLRGRDGDVFLICSDGLTSMVPEGRVGEILRAAGSLEQAARDLVQAANDAGGRDNITVVLFRLEDVGTAGGTADDRTMVGAQAPTTAEVRAAVDSAPPSEPVPAERTPEVVPRAPRPPREVRSERRRRRGWGALIITVIVLLPIIGGGYIASQAVFFIGVASNGSVTVFQGLPYDLPFGLHLYTSAYVTGLTPEQLPASRRAGLLDHKLRSHDDAFDLARQLELGQLEG